MSLIRIDELIRQQYTQGEHRWRQFRASQFVIDAIIEAYRPTAERISRYEGTRKMEFTLNSLIGIPLIVDESLATMYSWQLIDVTTGEIFAHGELPAPFRTIAVTLP